jgi:beta-lactam-binding protein with PASTA domain
MQSSNAEKKTSGKFSKFLSFFDVRRWWRNFYFRNVVFAICTVVLVLLLITLFLRVITRHGQTYQVPEFSDMNIYDARLLAASKSMYIQVNDSVFISHRPGGIVIEQNPKANTRVKKDRTIFVTINALSPKMVTVPDVTGVSLRQAKAIIEMQGLEIGRLSYASDMAFNNVLRQNFKGKPIAEGEKLVVGSRIDLVLGKNKSSVRTAVPNLTGLSAVAARSTIIEASLNAGRMLYDETVKTMTDTLEAKVYSQYPVSSEESSIEVGSSVDIMLTTNAARINH